MTRNVDFRAVIERSDEVDRRVARIEPWGAGDLVHAFPKVVNAPSNAICRKLGFELLGEVDFPARRGGVVRCNDWRFELFKEQSRTP